MKRKRKSNLKETLQIIGLSSLFIGMFIIIGFIPGMFTIQYFTFLKQSIHPIILFFIIAGISSSIMVLGAVIAGYALIKLHASKIHEAIIFLLGIACLIISIVLVCTQFDNEILMIIKNYLLHKTPLRIFSTLINIHKKYIILLENNS